MPGNLRVASWAIFCATILASVASAQTDSFESLIDSILRRHEGVVLPPDGPGQPAPEAPIENAPTQLIPQPPQQPQIVPVEPGPRPYTPPKIDRPPEEKPPGATTNAAPVPSAPPAAAAGAAPATAVPPDAASAPIDATAPPENAVPGDKRTLETLTVEEVNAATFAQSTIDNPQAGASPFVLKLQVMLDRVGASPGTIDSYYGGNVLKAVAAVETVLGDLGEGELTEDVWNAIGGNAAPPALVRYTITAEDLAYPFIASIPADDLERSLLPSLGYQSPEEMFGERFHMDTKLLRAFNPDADFRQAGTEIWVADVGNPITAKVARVVADRSAGQVRAYDAANHVIAVYAATIGSEANPSPIGDHVVSEILRDPVYALPGLGGGTLPPGPNNPLGTVWIALSEPGYGIQGSPEPSKIGKTAPDGTVRLTNWDAEELAGLLEPGIVVSFTP